MRVCSVEGCDREHYGRGWCRSHYQQWWRQTGSQHCSVDGCTGPATVRGWCTKHYQRWRRHDDPLTVVRDTRPDHPAPRCPCSVEDCENLAVAGGLCSTHYARRAKYGHELWPDCRPSFPCSICVHPAVQAIDERLEHFVPHHPEHGAAAIAREFGVSAKNLRYHKSVRHARALARMSAKRLQQARRMVAS